MDTIESQRAAEHLRTLLEYQRDAEAAALLFARHVAALPTADIEALRQHALAAQPADFHGSGIAVTAHALDVLRQQLADQLELRLPPDKSEAPALTVEAYEEVREAHEPSNNGNF